MKNCSSCGAPNDDSSKFCAVCGSKLETNTAQEPQNEGFAADAVWVEVEQEGTEQAGSGSTPEQDIYQDIHEEETFEELEGKTKKKDGMRAGTAGLVLGILSVVFCIFPCMNMLSFVESIIGLALSSAGRKRSGGMSKDAGAGRVLCIIALVFSIITILLYAAALLFIILNYAEDIFKFLGSINVVIRVN